MADEMPINEDAIIDEEFIKRFKEQTAFLKNLKKAGPRRGPKSRGTDRENATRQIYEGGLWSCPAKAKSGGSGRWWRWQSRLPARYSGFRR